MVLPPAGEKNYDWRGLEGEKLDEARRRWHGHIEFFVSKLPPELVADKSCSILNVGCGFGALQKAWMDKGYQNIIGIEHVAERAELARQYGCRAEVADYRKLTMFSDGEFQIVIFDRVLRDKQQGAQHLSEVFRVCSERSAILFYFHADWERQDIDPFFDLGWKYEWGFDKKRRICLVLYRGCDIPGTA